uniref:Uncharacterized protein n=1 Tax=Steinernema glaseri TaxID=37863 RepID=A0A1I8AS42_9BILA
MPIYRNDQAIRSIFRLPNSNRRSNEHRAERSPKAISRRLTFRHPLLSSKPHSTGPFHNPSSSSPLVITSAEPELADAFGGRDKVTDALRCHLAHARLAYRLAHHFTEEKKLLRETAVGFGEKASCGF